MLDKEIHFQILVVQRRNIEIMTFLFIVDVNPSMGEKLGTSMPSFSPLDLSKAGIETILQYMMKSGPRVNMPLILATTGNDRSAIVCPFGTSVQIFEDRVKNLTSQDSRATALDFSYTLSLNFSMFNKHRLKNGTDRFGYGMNPSVIEPLNAFLLTDIEGLKLNEVSSSIFGCCTLLH